MSDEKNCLILFQFTSTQTKERLHTQETYSRFPSWKMLQIPIKNEHAQDNCSAQAGGGLSQMVFSIPDFDDLQQNLDD